MSTKLPLSTTRLPLGNENSLILTTISCQRLPFINKNYRMIITATCQKKKGKRGITSEVYKGPTGLVEKGQKNAEKREKTEKKLLEK